MSTYSQEFATLSLILMVFLLFFNRIFSNISIEIHRKEIIQQIKNVSGLDGSKGGKEEETPIPTPPPPPPLGPYVYVVLQF